MNHGLSMHLLSVSEVILAIEHCKFNEAKFPPVYLALLLLFANTFPSPGRSRPVSAGAQEAPRPILVFSPLCRRDCKAK